MGSALREYGKLIVIVLMLTGLFSYLISSKNDGLMDQLSAAVPKSEVESQNNIHFLSEESKRLPPVLDVKIEKLVVGTTYQWKEFITDAYDMEGNSLEVQIVLVEGPGALITKEEFVEANKGSYKVTYRVKDSHKLITDKTICFVAD